MSPQTRQPLPVTVDEPLRSATIAVAAFLAPRLPRIVAELGELMRTQNPSSYSAEQLATMTEHIHAILELALTDMRQGAPPESTGLDGISTLARGWADEGWPLDPQGFQLGARHVMSVVAGHAGELGLSERTLFGMQDRLWAWATICASILAEARSEHSVALARRDAARRADFLRDLAAGKVTSERLQSGIEAYGLDAARPYFAVCADCEEPVTAAAVEAHVRRSGATSESRALQVVVDARLLAVTPRVPTPFEGTVIAVGPASMLPDVHASFAEATKALITARAFNLGGVVDLAALGPLPLVTEADALATRLTVRHLSEVDDRGRAGREIEDTVRTLLQLDRSVEATADRLHLHRNTVRYRVSRFSELTGLDPRRTEDLVLTWWLLTRRHVARESDHASAGDRPTQDAAHQPPARTDHDPAV